MRIVFLLLSSLILLGCNVVQVRDRVLSHCHSGAHIQKTDLIRRVAFDAAREDVLRNANTSNGIENDWACFEGAIIEGDQIWWWNDVLGSGGYVVMRGDKVVIALTAILGN